MTSGAALPLEGNPFVVEVMALFDGAVLDVAHLRDGDYTVGFDGRFALDLPTHALVRGRELVLAPGMRGEIDGRPIEAACAIPDGARARVEYGLNSFLVSSVAAPQRFPTTLGIEWRPLAYVGGVAAAWAMFLAMIFSMPPDPRSLSLDTFLSDRRLAQILLKPPEEAETKIPEWLSKRDAVDQGGGKGKRHKFEEGIAGHDKSKNKKGLFAIKGDGKDMHLAKELAAEAASKSGVIGLIRQHEGTTIASIFGRESAIGAHAENVMGGLLGTQVGEAWGNGGIGMVGSGKGGGGFGEGTIGLGNRLGTIGRGGGGGPDSGGYGRGAGGPMRHKPGVPDPVPGPPTVKGSLDAGIIRRVIRRHLNEVKFCYERQLLTKPNLYGRVMIQFTISGTGQVLASAVQSSTLNDTTVEQCIAGAVRRWEFPKPEAGIVIVGYPFLLKSAGSD